MHRIPLACKIVSVVGCIYVSFPLSCYKLSGSIFPSHPVPLNTSRAELCVVCSQKCLLNELLVYVDPINQIIA